MSTTIDRLIAPIEELLKLHTDATSGHAKALLLAIEQDVLVLPTVPLERQARFVKTMEKQILAALEIERIKAVKTSKAVVASTIMIVIRAILGLL